MMDSDPYIGQVLDEKYCLERLLGRGGMGAVYLASHLGTERYVALKLITPQFMGNDIGLREHGAELAAACHPFTSGTSLRTTLVLWLKV
jgi:serine/threonine protein kinase